MSETLFLIFELIGTVAFAVSGAMVGLSKKMDILGVSILGVVTAVGGGIIRDLVLGNTPPMTFRNPVYALVAIGVSVIIFFPGVRRFLFKNQKAYESSLLLMDSVGLGIFTVVGIETALVFDPSSSIFLLIFVGVITGTGGGILRDVLSGQTPFIFSKHFYASASIIGAIICIILWKFFGAVPAIYFGAAAVIILRLLAAKYHWKLPKSEL